MRQQIDTVVDGLYYSYRLRVDLRQFFEGLRLLLPQFLFLLLDAQFSPFDLALLESVGDGLGDLRLGDPHCDDYVMSGAYSICRVPTGCTRFAMPLSKFRLIN